MALSAATLSGMIKAELVGRGIVGAGGAGDLDDACDSIAEGLVDHVLANLEIKIPIGAVIVAAPGGTPNAAPIPCTVA